VARRLHPGTPHQAVDQAIERLGLREYVNRRAGHLSQGNAQRLGVAKALLHGPRLLILDEPANGLDPAGIVEIRQLLLDLTSQQGVTVFMSSHILAEVARLAGRIGIIHAGSLLQELDVAELERNRRRRLLVRARDMEAARVVLAKAGHAPEVLPDGAIELSSAAAIGTPDDVATLLIRSGVPLGAVILSLIMANLLAVMGWAAYFPWAVPGLFAQGKGYLLGISYPIAVLTGLGGMVGTYLWWKYADQSR
jgi:ABC-2 type transport system ATP-binding protein